jgi:trehalose-6-phosphate synthase
MKITLRFTVPLFVALTIIAYAIVPLVDALTFKWFIRDLDIRAKLIASTMQDSLNSALTRPSGGNIQSLFSKAIQDERLYALGLCDIGLRLTHKTQTFPKSVRCADPQYLKASTQILNLHEGPLHVAFHALLNGDKNLGTLVLIHDLSFVQRRSSDTKLYIAYFFLVLGVTIAFLTVIIAQMSWKGWIRSVRALLRGDTLFHPIKSLPASEIKPLIKDLRALVQDLETDRRTRDENQVSWSPSALREILQTELCGDEVMIVSNREPYIHVHREDRVDIQVPASGLVTALEPIMRACSGTWIAHGSGCADREVVDKFDRVAVPPDNPAYQIRRVWLSKEEEQGYYYGFANEGLWALCHIAHVRPIFRTQDWIQYYNVNKKFAATVLEEAKTDNPIVLVQDYHLALVPKMIRKRLPKSTIITFWHIPFPNPEVFGICPWREEILDGLLGSSIVGFHTLFHCHNFMDSIDQFLESRIDRSSSTISYRGKKTVVNHYPISIEYPVKWLQSQEPIANCKIRIQRLCGIGAHVRLGIGVDRLDYTKGILERFRAVERLLELDSDWIGRFTFIQIAAPSRSSIAHYQHFEKEVRDTANQINRRFATADYVPICLRVEHHEPNAVYEFYRAADLCFVSSLHDGMNLVAKEFIASRDDERGVLILSQFAGAARELPEALIVNPYDTDQCAMALKMALEMDLSEQRNRMRNMRGLVREFNVYRWTGRMLLDAARIRQRSQIFRHSTHQKPKINRRTIDDATIQ